MWNSKFTRHLVVMTLILVALWSIVSIMIGAESERELDGLTGACCDPDDCDSDVMVDAAECEHDLMCDDPNGPDCCSLSYCMYNYHFYVECDDDGTDECNFTVDPNAVVYCQEKYFGDFSSDCQVYTDPCPPAPCAEFTVKDWDEVCESEYETDSICGRCEMTISTCTSGTFDDIVIQYGAHVCDDS